MKLYQDFIQPGDLCFDIGANKGAKARSMLALGAQVVAVEPIGECCEFMRKRYGDKMQIVQKGIDAEPGTRILNIATYSQLSTFSTTWIDKVQANRFKNVSFTLDWDKKAEVAMTTLDELIHTYGEPAFIKIDVEGYEYNVLRGLSYGPRVISFEYTVPEGRDQLLDCLDYLSGIEPAYRYNYSFSESDDWALPDFVGPQEFIALIDEPAFAESGNGDVYAFLPKNAGQ
jgi:FkbM family methyltransferase